MDARIVEAVGRMHVARITGQMLAKESGYNASYVSEVLNGKRGTDQTVDKLMDALSRLEKKQAEMKQSAISAAYRSGMSKDKVSLQGAFFIDGVGEEQLAEVKGDKPHIREDMVRVGMGAADIRYRGEFDHWHMNLTLRYNKNGQYSLEQILNIIGICR